MGEAARTAPRGDGALEAGTRPTAPVTSAVPWTQTVVSVSCGAPPAGGSGESAGPSPGGWVAKVGNSIGSGGSLGGVCAGVADPGEDSAVAGRD